MCLIGYLHANGKFRALVQTLTRCSDEHFLDSFQDELARVLVTLFDSRHLLYQLLWNMFSKEVELADSMQTLFRGNSLASKIMTFCFKVCYLSLLSATNHVNNWNGSVI